MAKYVMSIIEVVDGFDHYNRSKSFDTYEEAIAKMKETADRWYEVFKDVIKPKWKRRKNSIEIIDVSCDDTYFKVYVEKEEYEPIPSWFEDMIKK